MAEYVLVKNAYKSPVRAVFDYLDYDSYKSPNEKQKQMLLGICDGVEIFKDEWHQQAMKKMKPGDYLYYVNSYKNLELIRIYQPKKLKSTNQ